MKIFPLFAVLIIKTLILVRVSFHLTANIFAQIMQKYLHGSKISVFYVVSLYFFNLC